MIVDFNKNPSKSIIYTSSIIFDFLKNNKVNNFDDVLEFSLSKGIDYALIFLSIDWLFLIGIIKEINNRNELILCD